MQATQLSQASGLRRGAFGASLGLHGALAAAAILPVMGTAPLRIITPAGLDVVWVAPPSEIAVTDAMTAPDAATAKLVEANAIADAPPLPEPPVTEMAQVAPTPAVSDEATPSSPPPAAPQTEPPLHVEAPADVTLVAPLPPPPPVAAIPAATPPPLASAARAETAPRRPPPQRPARPERVTPAHSQPAASVASSGNAGALTAAAAITPGSAAAAPPPLLVVAAPRYRSPPAPPVYPPRAVELGLSGTVLVRARVGTDGSTEEIRLWRTSGHPLLDAAALAAVRRWAFEAASVGGQRVEAWVEVPVHFRLN